MIPLIPCPTSSYDTIYTALKRAQGITNWTYGETKSPRKSIATGP